MPWPPNGEWEYRPRIRPADGIRARSQRGAFAKSWWATHWITALERLVDHRRLVRGRTYARQGQVVSLDIGPGIIDAKVQGSRRDPYRVAIKIPILSEAEWDRVLDVLAGRAIYAADLLAGEMPRDIEEAFASADASLFPIGRRAFQATCTCPDWVEPCKHVAAACYLVGERFDEEPFLMFELRGKTKEEIIAGLRQRRGAEIANADEALAEEMGQVPELEGDAESLWTLPADFSDFALSFDAPEVDAIAIKRLGAPPFARDPEKLMALIEPSYRSIADAARSAALGIDESAQAG